ncbi:hypothetical protein Tco_0907234 [Tanacetum coccineum]|uniref:Uncharacterized protein n=1 Tax=Tanacetum coccineum TaxID=301880 RepID=A0ABQ5CJS9_9ASTR
MFKNFNRDDMEDLWKIVKSRFIKNDPVDDMDNLLLRTLNSMFEPQVEDTIWTYQQGLTLVKNWKLYDSCGNNTTPKLPLLKLGDYEMWQIRIKQYFQVQDYALWEVIENGNSWVPATSQDGGACYLWLYPMNLKITFGPILGCKTMFVAIEARFRGNEATKKTQKALLKQQYENFNASSSESLNSIFNRLQKIVSKLAILGVAITQEDLNSKFLRSLPPEWNTHVVVWMNKADLETLSIDDLYNNFKIIEQDVKKSVSVNNGSQNLAFMTAQSTSNDIATLSDATVYAFLSNQPKGSQLVHGDLEQIHNDDLEEMDLKWQLALLSMRARKFYQRTGKKITINRSDIARFDKSKSDMAEEQVQTNMALMAFSDSECDDLIVKLNDSGFKTATYKRGLATLEDQLITYKKNEVLFCEEIGVLKREVGCKEYELGVLKTKLEKVKKEKKSIDFKITKFDKSAKDIDEMLESQRSDKDKQGLGYHAVPPPHPLIYNRPNKLDLSYSGLDEFKEPDFNEYGPRDIVLESTIDCDKELENYKKNTGDSLEKEQVSDNENSFVKSSPSVVKETVFILIKRKNLSIQRLMKNQLKGQLSMLRCIDHKVLEGIREIGMVRSPIN